MAKYSFSVTALTLQLVRMMAMLAYGQQKVALLTPSVNIKDLFSRSNGIRKEITFFQLALIRQQLSGMPSQESHINNSHFIMHLLSMLIGKQTHPLQVAVQISKFMFANSAQISP